MEWLLFYSIAITVFILLVFTIIALGILYYGFPHYFLRLNFRFMEYMAGMRIKFVGDCEMMFCYGEKNSTKPGKNSVVFIHGFSSSKDQFIPFFKSLPNDLHLIALDLPGHGASSVPDDSVEITVDYIIDSVGKFLELVGLDKLPIHLVGASMGGAIVGVYSAYHPDNVRKVSLICPAMNTPISSEFYRQVREIAEGGTDQITFENCAFLPQDWRQMKEMFDFCIHNKKLIEKMPTQIWRGLVNLRLPKNDFYLKLFRAMSSEEHEDLLEKLASDIRMPSQLVWGDRDQIIDVSGSSLLRYKLPDCQSVDIIENCGHTMNLDRPLELVKVVQKFIYQEKTK